MADRAEDAGAEQDPSEEHSSEQFWFNPRTREVEEGRLSAWGDRMGPYATREEAERALDTAEGRSEAWDEADRRWKEEWDD